MPRASRRLLGRSAIITAPWPALRCARAGADRGAAGRNAAAGPAIAAKIRRERRIVLFMYMDSSSVAGSWSRSSHGPAARVLVSPSCRGSASGEVQPRRADSGSSVPMASLSSAPGEAFASLAAAIRAAVAGDTVTLAPGEYEGPLELALDGLTVCAAGEGGGSVVVRATGASPVIRATGSGLTVVGLELRQDSAGSAVDCVAVARGSAAFRLCSFKSALGSGLAVSGAKVAVSAEECSIDGTGKYGCFVADQAALDARSCVIQSCKAAGVVSRGKGSRFHAEKCTIQNNGESAACLGACARARVVLRLVCCSFCTP